MYFVYKVEAYVASWIEIATYTPGGSSVYTVEAYVASWIEIIIARSHTKSFIVEAYVASWIEIYRTV